MRPELSAASPATQPGKKFRRRPQRLAADGADAFVDGAFARHVCRRIA